MFNYFLTGFMTVFKMGTAFLAPKNKIDLEQDIINVEKDLNTAFEKLTNNYERDKEILR